ncbi:unnamed protein product [Lampetra fluviatilis]
MPAGRGRPSRAVMMSDAGTGPAGPGLGSPSPGNPVFTVRAGALPPASSLYRTTAHDYGALSPGPEAAPCVHCPASQSFSRHLGECGMPRDRALNTTLDRSRSA